MTLWILAPLASFGAAVFLHGLTMRAPMRVDSVRRFLLVGFPLGAGLALLSIATLGLTSDALAQIVLYACLCELYIFCFTLVLSSVSVTMLIMLRRGPIPTAALQAKYDPREMVKLRLERLIAQGFIVRDRERLAVSTAGMRLNRAFGALQRFFRHDAR